MEDQMYNMYQYQMNVPPVPPFAGIWELGNFSQPVPLNPGYTDTITNVSDCQEPYASEDSFGLEFAAVQWLQLVTNAEKLFNNLLHSILLSGEEKEQIQRWLCLKQECEECVASEATSLGDQHRHALGRIDELTEDTDQMEEMSDYEEKSTDSQYESETESDFDSHHPDFEDKLDGYMERFKDKTDMLIHEKLARYCMTEDSNENVKSTLTSASSTNPVHQKGRRKSLHPGSIQSFMSELNNKGSYTDIEAPKPDKKEDGNGNGNLTLVSHGATIASGEPYRELKSLFSENDAKKIQIQQAIVDIESTSKRMKEVEEIIQSKEKFIKDLIKNSKTRASAKLKCEKKCIKFEEIYYKTRAQLAQAEIALKESKQEGGPEILMRQKEEVRNYKDLARQYEKLLKDIAMVKGITKESAKKVVELEESLMESKKEKEILEKQLRLEEESKHKLEQELTRDMQKVRTLEEKYKIQAAKLFEREKFNDGNEDSCLKLTCQASAFQQKDKLSIKEKMFSERQKIRYPTDAISRVSILDNVLKENQLHLDYREEKDENESHRQGIRNLRKKRDCLLEQRNSLEEKYLNDNYDLFPTGERNEEKAKERRRLECEEMIEAIDATIEYKNELICGRKSMDNEELRRREHEKQMLMDKLLNLSLDEMRTLLYKYFQKVIDLKENGNKLEKQIDELEHRNAYQAAEIQDLRHGLYAQHLKAELEKVDMQRHHQEKLHLLFRQFAEESSSSGTEAGKHLMLAKDSELTKCKRENKNLKRRLQEMAAATSRGVRRIRSRSASPEQGVLQALPSPASTTKMIRERNKVIIQLNAPKKKTPSSKGVSFNYHK